MVLGEGRLNMRLSLTLLSFLDKTVALDRREHIEPLSQYITSICCSSGLVT